MSDAQTYQSRTSEETARAVSDWMNKHGVRVESVFVPWSQSRNRDEKETDWNGKPTNRPRYSLNWRVTIKRAYWAGAARNISSAEHFREVVSLDYSSGIAHAPCYLQNPPRTNPEHAAYMKRLTAEIEQGFVTLKAPTFYDSGVRFKMQPDPQYKGQEQQQYRPKIRVPIEPGAVNVLACLAMDSHILDAGGFESWASELGYDPDSRSAEKIYRECLEQALKFRAGIGDSALDELRDATRDW